MEHNTNRILWTVLILAIGVALYVGFRPAANGLLHQVVDKTQAVTSNVNSNPSDNSSTNSSSISSSSSHTIVGTNLITQSDLKPGWLDVNGNVDGAGMDGGGMDFNSDNYIATNGETVFTLSSPDYAVKCSSRDNLTMYDSNKNYIGCQAITSPTITLSKSNVAYIRFSINIVDEGGTFGHLSDWLNTHRYKLEKGSKATPWES